MVKIIFIVIREEPEKPFLNNVGKNQNHEKTYIHVDDYCYNLRMLYQQTI